ncbi:MAG: hypothetical protein ACRCYU_21450 [Nocardioides sp.]
MLQWEYLELHRSRDAQFDTNSKYWLVEPGQDEYRELEVPGKDGASLFGIINRLGEAGWELLGPPLQVKVRMTYKNKNENYMDYADWREQKYLFKRPKQ